MSLEQDPDLRASLRRQLREARGAVLADAEGFEVVVHAIEAVGRACNPSGSSLHAYTGPLLCLVRRALELDDDDCRKQERDHMIPDLEAKLFLLRQTRNDHVHQGVHARNAAEEAVYVALVLEDALSLGWKDVRLRDVMVRRPVTAFEGDTLASIRRVMLSNSFSFVPVRIKGCWRLVSERWIAEQVVGTTRKPRMAALGKSVKEAEEELPKAVVLEENRALSSLKGKPLPELILVVEKEDCPTLSGVVSPSDFL